MDDPVWNRFWDHVQMFHMLGEKIKYGRDDHEIFKPILWNECHLQADRELSAILRGEREFSRKSRF